MAPARARPPRSRPRKSLHQRRRRTPKQPRKVRRRMARRAAKPAKAARRPAPARNAVRKPKTAQPPKRAAAPASPLPPGKLRIAVFGAGGTLGSRITAEASARGHQVTPIQRSPGLVRVGARRVGVRRADALDAESVAKAVQGHDAVVSAVAPPPDKPELLVRAARGLVAGCRAANVPRLVVVNGAGSLQVAHPDIRQGDYIQLLDTPDFPAAWRPTALAHRDALAFLRDAASGVQWTAVSPPALIQPGVRTGQYQIGTDRLLRGRDGKSQISAEDFAVAVVDELEKGRFKGKRMTVASP